MPDEKYLPIPLHSSDDESDFLLSINPRNKRSRTQPFVVFLLASAAAVVYTVLVVAATINRLELDPLCRGGPRVLPNVLHDAIEYIPKVWHDGHGDPDHDPWFGRPTPELSRTWMDLLECQLTAGYRDWYIALMLMRNYQGLPFEFQRKRCTV